MRAPQILRALVALAALGLAPGLARAQDQRVDPNLRPTTHTIGCTASGCHAPTLQHTYLHGPTAVAECTACHSEADATKHTFTLKRTGRDLCAFCHIDKSGTEGPVVHKPVADGECLSCHDPHGSESRKMLKRNTVGELCLSCHQQITHGANVHEPAAAGECTACHQAHTSDLPGLLVKPKRELCLSCHETLGEELTTSRHVHDPVNGDCTQCHATHASDHPSQLIAEPADLCTSCHQQQLETALTSSHKHSAVLEGRACLNCHQPHTSSHNWLQKDDPLAACLACHAESKQHAQETQDAKPDPYAPVFAKPNTSKADGSKPDQPQPGDDPTKPTIVHVATPAPDLGVGLPFNHGPVEDATCGECHGVHGAEHSRLLRFNYTENFVEPFSVDAYQLCFSCHDSRLVTERETTSATNFRNGSRNLHAVHVNAAEGRSCRACHDTHSSRNASMIRESTPYGQWRIPLNTTITEIGGSCASGCHKKQEYVRGPVTDIPAHAPEDPLQPEPAPPASGDPKAPSTSDGQRADTR
ncbi:MAG: hypothetical protein IPJ41_02975 [Phycisphaerales bacterium]|nr:hypothetical protein [Phycisphaerales bacterium]